MEMVVFLVVFVIAGLIATQTMVVTETLPILYLLKWCLGLFLTMLPCIAAMWAITVPVSYTHLVTKQIAVLLTGGALLLCALAGIFVLTQAFGKRLSQFTADLCQTLDHMIAGNEAPQRPEDSETQLARIGHRLARLYQIMQENRRRVDEERQELQTLVSDISHQDVYKRQRWHITPHKQ